MTDIGQVVMKLSQMGYRFGLHGEKVRYEWQGQGDPNPHQVRPLLALLKAHRDEVRTLLRCYCPKCGGVCFGTFTHGEERCMACYYQALKALNPGLELRH